MPTPTYSLIYEGGIRDGFDPASVKTHVAQLLKLDAKQAERLFSGRPMVLRHGLDEDSAVRYCARLNGLGMVVRLRAEEAAPAAPATAPPAPAVSGHSARAARENGYGEHAGHGQNDADGVRLLPFEFHGSGSEYFRIWIANLLLSILTLGIYSAWAKVRTLRYFYGNTRLDGSAFEYLGDPLKILKGRLIAFALLALYVFSEYYSPWLAGLAFLLLMLLTPWIVRSSLRFRNHNSAWRGVRFGFDGSLGGAVKAWLLWVVLGFLTLGLLMPYALFQQLRYAITGSRFGTARLSFEGGVGTVYKICLVAGGCIMAGGVLFAVFGFIAPVVGMLLVALGYFSAYAVFRAWLSNYRFNHSHCAGHRFEADYRFGSYLRLVVVNTLLVIGTLGLFYPWAKVRSARYAADHTSVVADGSLERFTALQREDVSATGGEMGEFFDFDLGF